MYKNQASQKIAVFAYAGSDHASLEPGQPVTGAAGTITAKLSLDENTTLVDANGTGTVTELSSTDAPGVYIVTLSQANTNCDRLVVFSKSTTTGVLLDPVMAHTIPGSNTAIVADTRFLDGSSGTASNLSLACANYSATRGLSGTALPAAAAGAAGGIPTSTAGKTAFNDLDAAAFRAAIGLASANLDTQITALTNLLGTPDGATIAADLLTLLTRLTATRAGYLDAAISSRSTLDSSGAQTAANAALVALHLDHLLAVDYDPASKPGVATALLNELIENDGGLSRFTVNALENAPSGTGASAATIADAVWDEVLSGHTTAGTTGAALDAAGGSGASAEAIRDAILDRVLSGNHDTAGTVGLLLQFLDAAITSRSSHDAASVRTALQAVANDFKADVSGLSTIDSSAVQTAAEAALTAYDPPTRTEATSDKDAILTRLGSPAGASVSADVAAVKTDTGNLVTRLLGTLFNGITSLAEWIRTIARSDTADSVALAELNGGGIPGDFNESTDSLEAIRDNQSSSGGATAEAVRIELDANSTKLAAILEDTRTTIPSLIGTPNFGDVVGDLEAIYISVSEILTDTSTTIPSQISGISTSASTDEVAVVSGALTKDGTTVSQFPPLYRCATDVSSKPAYTDDGSEIADGTWTYCIVDDLGAGFSLLDRAGGSTTQWDGTAVASPDLVETWTPVTASGETPTGSPTVYTVAKTALGEAALVWRTLLARHRDLAGSAAQILATTIPNLISGLSSASSPNLLQTTTIATLEGQAEFTLTAGSADDNAYNGCLAIVTDASTATQKAVGFIQDYVGASKTVYLVGDPGVFTMAAGDTISIIAANDEILQALNAKLGLITSGTTVTIDTPVAIAEGDTITARAGDSWSFSLNDGGDLSSRADLIFAIFADGATTDDEALVFISEDNGLTRINGAAYATAADGTVTVTDVLAGFADFTVADEATLLLAADNTATWAVKVLNGDGTSTTIRTGTFQILPARIRRTAD